MRILDSGRLERRVRGAKIGGMNERVTSLPDRAERGRRLDRAVEARRRLESSAEQAFDRRGGRAWINGREVGGTHPSLSHLESSYD
jgi:hypothetical protein